MPLHAYRPVGNGWRTDHPIPDLPFVDDQVLPLDDPQALEALGRHQGEDVWGREDRIRDGGGWAAFTTDPTRHDLAWCVRWHPEHGRSVVLYRDEDASGVHMSWWGEPLLFRAGGYWWDGTTWYRPSQVWDRSTETYLRRTVPAATTITAADRLTAGANPAHGRGIDVTEVDPDAPPVTRWVDHLAWWAEHRNDPESLTRCVVGLIAPELSGDQLIGATELAQIGGVAPSTLRAYLSRGESEVPSPQAVVGGRAMWARPVAEEWAERRRTSSEGAAEPIQTQRSGSQLAAGVDDLRQRFTRTFYFNLWEGPRFRKRWALRWRTEAAVREVAEDLGWTAATSIGRVVPMDALGSTLRHAILDEFATSKSESTHDAGMYPIHRPIVRMLDWLIRHEPTSAAHAIGELAADAHQRMQIPRADVSHSLATALSLDGELEFPAYREFLDRTLPPEESP